MGEYSANAHMAAIARIEQLAAEHGIKSQFRRVDGYLFAHDASADSDIDSELDVAMRQADVASATRKLLFGEAAA